MTTAQRALCLLLLFGTPPPFGRAPGADAIPPQRVDGKVEWVYNYGDGRRLARASGKPLFVVFRCER
jgi:hypothetical protein